MSKKKNNKKGFVFKILALTLFLLGLFGLGSGKESSKNKKNKPSSKKYCRRAVTFISEHFIPHPCNDYKPKILHIDTLILIGLFLAIIKAAVVGYGFFIYSQVGYMEPRAQVEAVELINRARSDNGLEAVRANDYLNDRALEKAQDMLAKDYFAHYSPEGKAPWDLISRNKYPYLYVGENLARNFTSVTMAHKALMNSPSHKDNILNKKYTDVGIAVVSGALANEETTVLVQLFGSRKAEPRKTADKPPSVAADEQKKESVKDETTTTNKAEEEIIAEQEEVGGSLGPEQTIADEADKERTSSVLGSADIVTSTPASVLSQGPRQLTPEEDGLESVIRTNERELNNTVKYFAVEQDKEVAGLFFFNSWADYLFFVIFSLLLLLLFINIVVKISIQHKPVIIQTLLLLIFIYSLIQVKINFVQDVLNMVVVF
jgi:hypothetical protein